MMKINDLSIVKHAESLYCFFFLEIIRFLLLYLFHDLNLYIYSARKCFVCNQSYVVRIRPIIFWFQ